MIFFSFLAIFHTFGQDPAQIIIRIKVVIWTFRFHWGREIIRAAATETLATFIFIK